MSFLKTCASVVFGLVLFACGMLFYVFVLDNKYFGNPPLQINYTISVNGSKTPTHYSANPVFSSASLLKIPTLTLQDKTIIASGFKIISQRFEQSKLCKGGSYSITPLAKYDQESQSSQVYGQNFHAEFSCEFDKAQFEEYEKLLHEVGALANEMGYFALQTPKVRPIVKNEQQNEIDSELKGTLIEQAKQSAEVYQKSLSKICKIERIDINDSHAYPKVALMRSVEAQSIDSSALPIESSEEFSLSAQVSLRCK